MTPKELVQKIKADPYHYVNGLLSTLSIDTIWAWHELTFVVSSPNIKLEDKQLILIQLSRYLNELQSHYNALMKNNPPESTFPLFSFAAQKQNVVFPARISKIPTPDYPNFDEQFKEWSSVVDQWIKFMTQYQKTPLAELATAWHNTQSSASKHRLH